MKTAAPASARRVVAPYGGVRLTAVGRGYVLAVREAANSTNEQICSQLVVPARGTSKTPSPTGARVKYQHAGG